MQSPFVLTIPADRVADARAMLTHWERHNPWDHAEAKRLEAAIVALVYTLAAPKLLRQALSPATSA